MTVTGRVSSIDTSRQGPTVPARLARALVHAAERAGAAPAQLLADSRIAPAALDDHSDDDARLPLEAVHDLIELAVLATGDELLGVHAAQHRALSDFGSFGFLVTTSGSLGEAIDECQRFQQLMGESLAIARSGEHVALRYQRLGRARPAQRHVVEMTAYDWAVNLALALRQPVRAACVRFAHDVPAPWVPALEAAFACRVELGAPLDEIVLPASLMSAPMPDASADLHAFFVRHARAQLARLPDDGDLLSRVRAQIAARLPGEPPGLEGLARELGVGPRTLQRRLHEAGFTVRALVDEVRRARAFELLETPLPASEIGVLLGYSEPAAFHRAFKRWTGMTPETFRTHYGA